MKEVSRKEIRDYLLDNNWFGFKLKAIKGKKVTLIDTCRALSVKIKFNVKDGEIVSHEVLSSERIS